MNIDHLNRNDLPQINIDVDGFKVIAHEPNAECDAPLTNFVQRMLEIDSLRNDVVQRVKKLQHDIEKTDEECARWQRSCEILRHNNLEIQNQVEYVEQQLRNVRPEPVAVTKAESQRPTDTKTASNPASDVESQRQCDHKNSTPNEVTARDRPSIISKAATMFGFAKYFNQ